MAAEKFLVVFKSGEKLELTVPSGVGFINDIVAELCRKEGPQSVFLASARVIINTSELLCVVPCAAT